MTETHQARNVLFNQLLKVSHRDYTPLVAALSSALASDPDFISRACVFIANTSEIRDQVDAAIITLLQSPHHYGYREAGRCLLLGDDVYEIEPSCRGLPPFRIFRIVEYMGLPVIASHPHFNKAWRFSTEARAQTALPKIARRINSMARGSPRESLALTDFDTVLNTLTVIVDKNHRQSPRLMRNITRDYIQFLQRNPLRFDSVVMYNRKVMQRLYRSHHWVTVANQRTQDILYHGKMPSDSKLAVLKEIANTKNIHEQARLVVEHKIPYTVATSVLPKMSPIVAVALIDVMSPQEALNSRAWVEHSGILNIPEVKDVFVSKVSQATKSAATADHRQSAKGKDVDVEAAVQVAKERSVAKQQKIEEPILLLIDMSSSMDKYFPFVQQLGARIAPLCVAGFMAVLFNDFARELKVEGVGLAAWQNGLRGVRASGWTSPLAGLSLALRNGFTSGKIVILTDGGENRPHNRVGAFANGLSKLGAETPSVVVIGVPDTYGLYHKGFAQSICNIGANVDEFVTDGTDYYVLDQVASVLGGPPAVSIVQRIMEVEVPRRVG